MGVISSHLFRRPILQILQFTKVLLGFLISYCLFAGDLTLTSKISGTGPLGKGSGIQVEYLSATKKRTNNSATQIDSLVDFKRGFLYKIDHSQKKIEKLSFKGLQESFKAMDQETGVDAMTKMIFGDVSEAKTEDLGSEIFLGRLCNKVRLTVGKWVEDILLDPHLSSPLDPGKELEVFSQLPGNAVLFRLKAEKAKLKGVRLRIHQRGVMGIDQIIEVISIHENPIPSRVWKLPKGYAWIDQGKKEKEEHGKKKKGG